MCGFIIIKAKKIDLKLKKNFLSSLAFLKHRGPDQTKYKAFDNSLIGFNRLSINNIGNGELFFIDNFKPSSIQDSSKPTSLNK